MSTSAPPRPEEAPAAPPRLWGWRTWASLALAFGALGLLAARVDFAAVLRELAATRKSYVVLGLVAHYATYYIRGSRWKFVLNRTPLEASRLKYGLVVFFYNFVDNLVPAKLGDVYAAHLARINFGVRRSEALGSIVFMRLIDGWVVLVLAVISSWLQFAERLPPLVFWALVGGVVVTLCTSAIALGLLVVNRKMPDRVPEPVRRILRDLRQRMVPSRKRVSGIVLVTALIWLLELLWIHWLARGFGLDLGPATVVFVATIPLLASAFPFTPSGTGAVELALYSCLIVVGASTAVAASFTFLNRIIDYWLHIALGVVAWGVRRRLGLRAWTSAPGAIAPLAPAVDRGHSSPSLP